VERKHILESEYANIKHTMSYIGKFRQISYPVAIENNLELLVATLRSVIFI